MNYTILLVEDNSSLLLSLKLALRNNYLVDTAVCGIEAVNKCNQNQYDCVVLDLGLPDISGMEVCAKLRRLGNSVPIIILSADDKVDRKAALLDCGADDYMTKPADITELEARLRTVIRRSKLSQSLGNYLNINGVVLDSLSHTVERDGVEIALRPKEFSLLECLMNNAGRVVSRPILLQYAWDEQADVWTNVVDVHIKYLRDKIDHPFSRPLIRTVHGLGYKFDASNVANIMKGGKAGERTVTSSTH